MFISYARGTALTHARALRDSLAQQGRGVFFDEREIPYGSKIPRDLAEGLIAARVAVVFLDELYLTRPYCIHEFQVITALASDKSLGDGAQAGHLVVALPESGNVEHLLPHLPPSAAVRSWPRANETGLLAKIVAEQLACNPLPLQQLLESAGIEAVRRVQQAGQVPTPSALATRDLTALAAVNPVFLSEAIPDSRTDGFVGREHDLWKLFAALVTPRAFGSPLSCAVQGPGGVGKSQIAAEFAWRYGPRFFPGGVIWISASDGDMALADQFRTLLGALGQETAEKFRTGSDPAEELRFLQRAVANAIAARDPQPILWIVDSIPEPGGGASPKPAQHWCPARQHVTLLCTTRRAGLEGVEATIELASLTSSGAVALLTRPPVEAAWLKPSEWTELASWVGELPLALAILRDSLTNGFVTAKALATTRDHEPAATLESYVDALRGEVAAPYLRGVAEAFEMSYAGLATSPELREAAHLFARLATAPISEDNATTLIPSALLGRLTKRSWIQPVGGPAERRWVMHRIPASYLRSRMVDPANDYARLFNWLHQLVRDEAPFVREHVFGTHLRVIVSEFLRHLEDIRAKGSIGDHPALAPARALALAGATVDLGDRNLRGVRYLAAELAQGTGVAADVVAELSAPAILDDEIAASTLPNILSGMPDSSEAARLMERLIGDARRNVQDAAFVSASSFRSMEIAVLLLRTLIADPDPEWKGSVAGSIDWTLTAANPELAEILDAVLQAVTHGLPHERAGAVAILCRTLVVHADDSTLTRHRIDDLRRALLHTARLDSDDFVAGKAADAAGLAFDAADLEPLQQAYSASQDDVSRDRLATILARYVLAGIRPRPPKVLRTTLRRDGSLEMEVQMSPERGEVPPDVFPLLVRALARTKSDAVTTQLMRTLSTVQGMPAVGAEIGRFLDMPAPESALALAEGFLSLAPDVPQLTINGHWWRAMALENLGRTPEALGAYDSALQAAPPNQPALAPLYERRAAAKIAINDHSGALPDLDCALQLVPGSPRAHHLRSLCLYHLERYPEAIAAFNIAIQNSPPGDAELTTLYEWRAASKIATRDFDGALLDLDHAISLVPGSPRAHHLRSLCLYNLKRHPEAEAAADCALAINDSVGETWFFRGIARYAQGDTAGALADMEKSVALAPGDGRAVSFLTELRAYVAKPNPPAGEESTVEAAG